MNKKNKYRKRISKEKWLNLVLEEIENSAYGTIRPTEVKFVGSHFYWIKKCKSELGVKNYGDTYTLWFRPGNHKKADARARIDSVIKSDSESYNQKIKYDLIKYDFTQFINKWLQQLPRIAMMYGAIKSDNKEQDTPYNGLNIEGHALFIDFKNYIERLTKDHPNVFLNPFVELEEFDKILKRFLEKRKEIIDEIIKITTKEIGNKIFHSKGIEYGHQFLPIKFIEGILGRLNIGISLGNFSDEWFENFNNFDSYVKEMGNCYGYYLRNMMIHTLNI